ncbi:MAG: hypothetical protein HS114_21460 [Anaerolineales bacterium]|nr:hypothetical protein [Anaerolineales bacterium]
MEGSELKGPSQVEPPLFSCDQLGETHSYFGFEDAHALQEALRFLGPGVADETLAAYYEHFLASLFRR